jgi:uncharacterized protein (TIRG00374 family)
LAVAVGLGTVSWAGEGAAFWLVLKGLGVQPTVTLLSQAIFILAFSVIVGGASTLPGGLGAAEVSLAGMLAFVVGLPRELAASAALLIRSCTLWFGVRWGSRCWPFSDNDFSQVRSQKSEIRGRRLTAGRRTSVDEYFGPCWRVTPQKGKSAKWAFVLT